MLPFITIHPLKYQYCTHTVYNNYYDCQNSTTSHMFLWHSIYFDCVDTKNLRHYHSAPRVCLGCRPPPPCGQTYNNKDNDYGKLVQYTERNNDYINANTTDSCLTHTATYGGMHIVVSCLIDFSILYTLTVTIAYVHHVILY